mgnify:CR=1 FL=1
MSTVIKSAAVAAMVAAAVALTAADAAAQRRQNTTIVQTPGSTVVQQTSRGFLGRQNSTTIVQAGAPQPQQFQRFQQNQAGPAFVQSQLLIQNGKRLQLNQVTNFSINPHVTAQNIRFTPQALAARGHYRNNQLNILVPQPIRYVAPAVALQPVRQAPVVVQDPPATTQYLVQPAPVVQQVVQPVQQVVQPVQAVQAPQYVVQAAQPVLAVTAGTRLFVSNCY